MSKRVRDRSMPATQQMGIAFPSRVASLDAKTRKEAVDLLARLLLDAARRSSEGEVRDDTP